MSSSSASGSETKSPAPTAPSWPLRFKSPLDYPGVAKFSDVVSWETAKKPLRMYYKEEELREDENGDIVKDAAYYKRRRKIRTLYRKRSTLVLEDANSASTGFRFEGHAYNLTLAEIEDAKKMAESGRTQQQVLDTIHSSVKASSNNQSSATSSSSSNAGFNGTDANDVPFRYVLLQFIKKEGNPAVGQASGSEVNVIPVGNMFALKKAPGQQKDELLTDIDNKIEQELVSKKEFVARYKGIKSALDAAEKLKRQRDGDAAGGGGGGGFRGGFDATSLFGSSSAAGKKLPRMGANTAASFLDDNGVDLDVLKEEMDQWKGDYGSRFADDEEDYVHNEQAHLNEIVSNELSSSLRFDGVEETIGGDDDDDDDEDASTDDDEAGRGEDEDDGITGMVDASMVASATEARDMLKGLGKGASTRLDRTSSSSSSSSSSSGAGATGGAAVRFAGSVPKSGVSDTADAPIKSALKRRREETDKVAAGTTVDAKTEHAGAAASVSIGAGVSVEEHHRVSFTEPSSPTTAATATAEPDAKRRPTSKGRGSGDYSFSLSGVRQFILDKGGWVTSKDLEYFRQHIKDYGQKVGDKKAAKDRFYEILNKLTDSKEEALHGKVLVLKKG